MELEESGPQGKGKSLKSICIWDDLLKEMQREIASLW